VSGHGKRGRGDGGHGGGGGHGGWLVTYADLLTLLMVVFLVLWVIAQLDLAKFKNFKEGLGDFGNPAAEAAAASADTVVTDGTDPAGGPGDEAVDPLITSTGELTTEGLNNLETDIQEAITLAGLPDIVSVTKEDRGLVISVSTDDLKFEAGSATLGPNAVSVLSSIAPPLRDLKNHILVEGHTDKRPMASSSYDNLDLSMDRASAVVKLLRQLGVDPALLSAAGYGEMRPLDPGDSEEAYALNRRVEIVVLAGVEPPASTDTTVAETVDTVTEAVTEETPAEDTTPTEETPTETTVFDDSEPVTT
jgi:chemotaxis protein MotB